MKRGFGMKQEIAVLESIRDIEGVVKRHVEGIEG
jgi:hypothetical protein